MWNLTKALNDEVSQIGQILLQKDEQTYTGKQAADLFIEEYEEISNLAVPAEREQEITEELLEHQNQDQNNFDFEMNSPFIMEELKTALSSLSLKKAPGPDQVTNGMLIKMERSNNSAYTQEGERQEKSYKLPPNQSDKLCRKTVGEAHQQPAHLAP